MNPAYNYRLNSRQNGFDLRDHIFLSVIRLIFPAFIDTMRRCRSLRNLPDLLQTVRREELAAIVQRQRREHHCLARRSCSATKAICSFHKLRRCWPSTIRRSLSLCGSLVRGAHCSFGGMPTRHSWHLLAEQCITGCERRLPTP